MSKHQVISFNMGKQSKRNWETKPGSQPCYNPEHGYYFNQKKQKKD